MNNKKAISAVVATVLIILITVAAVTIMWAAIIPMIRENVEGSSECFDASAALSVMSDYSCYNSTSGNVSIQVSRGTGEFELEKIKLQAGYQGTTISTEILKADVPGSNEEKVYEMNVTSLGGADEVGVVAFVQAGNTEKECPGSGMIPISPCS